ncbi:helix-turn-helix domain-containing protein [Azospirillum sp.]|uniref:helix-turn-helix domain-containing protein n=1 Tax=Azospirillum sp. TaxID=34012 RepID=UPI002D590928|nr:helix-turn-helix domain-containing protein [Azospirillum sp.]HYD65726.1 helix-turn-helix domain-containing protein [Azospirillum sp.]
MADPRPSDKLKLLLAVATAGRLSTSAGKASPPSAAMVVLVLLLDYLGPDGCFPAAETLAADSGMNLRTVQRGLDWLAEGGWISVRGHEESRRAGGRSNRYAFNFEGAEGAVQALYADRRERRAARRGRGQTTAVSSHVASSIASGIATAEVSQFSSEGDTAANPPQFTGAGFVAETPQSDSVNYGHSGDELRHSVPETAASLPHESVTEPGKGTRDFGASLRDAPKALVPADIEAAFGRFWSAYPYRVNKIPAREAFTKLLTSGAATADQLIDAAKHMVATASAWEQRDRTNFCRPNSWLSCGLWKQHLPTHA